MGSLKYEGRYRLIFYKADNSTNDITLGSILFVFWNLNTIFNYNFHHISLIVILKISKKAKLALFKNRQFNIKMTDI